MLEEISSDKIFLLLETTIYDKKVKRFIPRAFSTEIFKRILHSLLTSSPDGQCFVFGPDLLMNLFTNRMFANVPRDMTWTFPLREPYELNSREARPRLPR